MALFGAPAVQGGREEPATAWFPTSGLLGLYKLDETDGARLYDATGNLPYITAYSGVTLNCAANVCYINDMTFLGLLNGLSIDFGVALEFTTPALISTSTEHTFIAGSAQSNAPIRVFMVETASTGDTTNRFVVSTRFLRTNANKTVAIGQRTGLKPSTGYQVIYRFVTVANVCTCTTTYREVGSSEWVTEVSVADSDTAGETLLNNSSASYQILRRATGQPYAGEVSKILVAHGVYSLDTLKENLQDPVAATIVSTFGTNARYWHFHQGAGTVCTEYITATTPTISTTGTVTWNVASPAVRQHCLRQGTPNTGKRGIALGGESGFVRSGRVAYSGHHRTPILNAGTGWTLIATLRVGDTLPAAERSLVSVYGMLSDGTAAPSLIKTPGVHITYTAAGTISAMRKNSAVADSGAGSDGTTIALGPGARYAVNGEFRTYAISCDATGALKSRLIGRADTSVTTVATVAANAANLLFRSTRVRIGDPALDCDLVVAAVGVYGSELSDAEIAQFRAASSPAYGAEVYVDAAANVAGNGTQRFPYKVLQSALRVRQPGQTIHLNGGTANSRIDTSIVASNALAMASTAGGTFIGTNSPKVVSTLGVATKFPVNIDAAASGTWIFHDIDFDATDAGVNNTGSYTDGATCYAFLCDHSGADALEMYGCTTQNAVKADESTGSGLIAKCPRIVIHDHTSVGNEEHCAYFRIQAASPVANYTFDIRNFNGTSAGEDGIKISNEFSDGSSGGDPTPTRAPMYWTDVTIDRPHIQGGKNQLYLTGIAGGTVTNFLCEGEDASQAFTAGIQIGGASDYMITSDLHFYNGTVRDYGITGSEGYGINNKNSSGCTMTNVVTSGCFRDVFDAPGTLTSSHCSGDCADEDYFWPAGNDNQPEADITFDDTDDAHISSGDGFEDGENLWTTSTLLRTDLDGDARPEEGAWNRGAY